MNYAKIYLLALTTGAALINAGCSTAPVSVNNEEVQKTAITQKSADAKKPALRQNATPAEREFQAALTLMEGGRPQDAEKMLLAMTKTYPKLSGPYANLGILYFKSNREEKAKEAFTKVLSLNGTSGTAYNYLGVIHRNNGEFQRAHDYYQKALEIDPKYASAVLNLGILYDLYLQKPHKALKHYQQYQNLAGTEDRQVKMWIADLKNRTTTNAVTAGEGSP